MSVSADLINDFQEASRFLAGNPQECNQEYYNKGSVVMFNSVTEKTLTAHCVNVLDPHNETDGVTLTTKGNIDNSKNNECDWKCFEKDTVLFALTPCKIKCIPHTLRKEWATIKDYNNLGDFTLNISTGDAVLMAYSVPWFLKEGRAKAYTVTKKTTTTQKTPTSKEITKKKTTTEEITGVSKKKKTEEETAKEGSKPAVLMKTFKECAEKHIELKARIAKLDQRVWNDKGTNTATVKKYEETLNEESSKDSIKKYANSLSTLEARIVAAENDTSLPPLLKSLEESKALLDSLSNVQGGGAAFKNRLASSQKLYDDLVKPQLNLIGRAKEIHGLLDKLKGHAHTTSSSNSNTTSNNKSVGGGGGGEIEVPQIDEGTLTPYTIDHADGPDGYMAVIQSIAKPGKDYATMTQALKNPQVTALYEKYVEQREVVGTQTQMARRDPSLTVNVTLFAAYGEALQKVYDDTKANKASGNTNGRGGVGTTKAPPKTIKCDECERRVKAFEGSNLCRECWSHKHLEPILEGLEERADYLSRKLKKEAKQGGDEDEEESPLQKVYNDYVDLNEELIIAHQAFSVPNSSIAAWDKLKALIDRADELLPKKPGASVEEEEDSFDPDEEADDFVEHSSESSSPKKSKKNRKRSISDEDEEDEEEEGEDDSLAHKTLLTLQRFPVQTVRENLLEAYAKGQYTWVEEELKRLEAIKEIYGFEVIELYKEDGVTKRGEPEEWHTYFLKESEAAKLANAMRVKDKTDTKKLTKKIEPSDLKAHPKESKQAKHEEEEEEEEDEMQMSEESD